MCVNISVYWQRQTTKRVSKKDTQIDAMTATDRKQAKPLWHTVEQSLHLKS